MTASSSPLQPEVAGTIAVASWQARLGLVYWRHGLWVPLVGMVLAIAAVAVWQSQALVQQSNELAVRPMPQKAAPAAASASATAGGDAQRLADFRRVLQPAKASTTQVRRLIELTQPELAWQRAQFHQIDDTVLGAVQLQIDVPVVGEYRQMRKAIDRALLDMPNLALDQVTFRRQQASESRLEARLRFSLWLRQDGEGAR